MHSVPLPDPIYAEAAQVAASIGLGVDAFIAEAVQQRIEDERPFTLTPEQLAACDRAAADIEAGNFYTVEQVREHFIKRHAAAMDKQQP